MRYYLGVDWADQTHAIWVVGADGTKIAGRTVPHTAEGFSEGGHPAPLRDPRPSAGPREA